MSANSQIETNTKNTLNLEYWNIKIFDSKIFSDYIVPILRNF